MWKTFYALFVLFLHAHGYLLTIKLEFDDHQLYEGSRCRLENGAGEGVCKKATDCSSTMQKIHEGDYTSENRCGFKDFEKMFCCATKPARKLKNTVKPAEAACKMYKKKFKEVEGDGYVYTAVINGVRAKPGEFPHMAALGYPVSEQEMTGGIQYVCGGTLISEKHVLTAAHCVSNIQGLVPVEVKLGTTDLGDTKSRTMQRIPISKITKHPEYKRSLNYHDVAILELHHPVNFTIDVYPTCLLTKPLPKWNVRKSITLVVLGWGSIDLDGTLSTKLLKADGLQFVDKNRCYKSYKNVRAQIPNGLDDGMICVRDPDTTRKADTCWGDSGGPLLISIPSFPPLVGITSFGQACGTGTPGVYASVYQYLNWIEDQVWPKSN